MFPSLRPEVKNLIFEFSELATERQQRRFTALGSADLLRDVVCPAGLPPRRPEPACDGACCADDRANDGRPDYGHGWNGSAFGVATPRDGVFLPPAILRTMILRSML